MSPLKLEYSYLCTVVSFFIVQRVDKQQDNRQLETLTKTFADNVDRSLSHIQQSTDICLLE